VFSERLSPPARFSTGDGLKQIWYLEPSVGTARKKTALFDVPKPLFSPPFDTGDNTG
jgi:hypothetical protein